jgi:hypothetical protein
MTVSGQKEVLSKYHFHNSAESKWHAEILKLKDFSGGI